MAKQVRCLPSTYKDISSDFQSSCKKSDTVVSSYSSSIEEAETDQSSQINEL